MTTFVTETELQHQRDCTRRVRALHNGKTAFVDTYGCQQNEADSERMRGMLADMGFILTDDDKSDVVVVNTCAVREHAEQRALGNIGHMSHYKKINPNQIIILAGCMAGEQTVRDRLRTSYRYVNALLDTTSFWRLPETVYRLMSDGKRIIENTEPDNRIAEGMPVIRTHRHKAFVSIMYGCNNFCSYCVVPYVRGRERSRKPDDILNECRDLIADGCKDIMLLGQNVNSYDGGIGFPELLSRVASIDGDFVVRFMTSHPKDCTRELIDVIAAHPRIERHIHLPVQSGSDSILQKMNRRYTVSEYLALVDYARSVIPDVGLTSDVIVGFPTETDEDFQQTLELVKRVRYDSIFTFIYSKRAGTPAAEMVDDTPKKVISERFERLTDLQNSISGEVHNALVGKTLRVLIDGEGRGELNLTARTQAGRLVNLAGDRTLIGQFCDVTITDSTTWSLIGTLD